MYLEIFIVSMWKLDILKKMHFKIFRLSSTEDVGPTMTRYDNDCVVAGVNVDINNQSQSHVMRSQPSVE